MDSEKVVFWYLHPPFSKIVEVIFSEVGYFGGF